MTFRTGTGAAASGKPTDVRVQSAAGYFLPVATRMPLKFGPETVTGVTCARVCVTVVDRSGKTAHGWGETPLSVTWVWPSSQTYEARHAALKDFCRALGEALVNYQGAGHPIELGHDFQHDVLPALTERFNAERGGEPMPYLAALVCLSAFDIAIHDAYGILHERDAYSTYTGEFLSRDLASFLTEVDAPGVSFAGQYPADYLDASPPARLPAWHLVGGVDPLEDAERTGSEPDDGYPVVLADWIRTDGLKCLKIKLRGTDAAWDYERMVRVGCIGRELGAEHLSADFNCTVTDPSYVNEILDRLRADEPEIDRMILYVEQPFPYDLEQHRIDVHDVSARKPLFLDESAHDWQFVRLGRSLGWSGVALKTCKTQTGALLSLCWAKAHGMPLMVQDLTNAMLAQIPHLRLAAHAGTIMGVETNSMQFYPAASDAEAVVHPGMYRRRAGHVDLSTLGKTGFGYRNDEIARELPQPAFEFATAAS